MKKNYSVDWPVFVARQIVVWYYMKLLCLRKGDQLFEINFEFKWKQPATKQSSTNNFSHEISQMHRTDKYSQHS